MKLEILTLLLLLNGVAAAFDPWSFVVLADWHGAESFATKPDASQSESYIAAREIFRKMMASHKPDMILLPGDTQTGHWYERPFRKYLEKRMSLSNLSVNDTIAIAAENTYSTSRQLFSDSGFEKVLLAFGDHELGKHFYSIPNSFHHDS